jgi:hypothetical protein
MLAYPISTASCMPWIRQDVVRPVAQFLNVVSALNPGAVGFPVLIAACAWVCGVFTLSGVVACGYYRERHSNSLPVKVRRRGCEGCANGGLCAQWWEGGGGGLTGRVEGWHGEFMSRADLDRLSLSAAEFLWQSAQVSVSVRS